MDGADDQCGLPLLACSRRSLGRVFGSQRPVCVGAFFARPVLSCVRACVVSSSRALVLAHAHIPHPVFGRVHRPGKAPTKPATPAVPALNRFPLLFFLIFPLDSIGSIFRWSAVRHCFDVAIMEEKTIGGGERSGTHKDTADRELTSRARNRGFPYGHRAP
nr:hypothetical protein [Pandoravirus massiliensis]